MQRMPTTISSLLTLKVQGKKILHLINEILFHNIFVNIKKKWTLMCCVGGIKFSIAQC